MERRATPPRPVHPVSAVVRSVLLLGALGLVLLAAVGGAFVLVLPVPWVALVLATVAVLTIVTWHARSIVEDCMVLLAVLVGIGAAAVGWGAWWHGFDDAESPQGVPPLLDSLVDRGALASAVALAVALALLALRPVRIGTAPRSAPSWSPPQP